MRSFRGYFWTAGSHLLSISEYVENEFVPARIFLSCGFVLAYLEQVLLMSFVFGMKQTLSHRSSLICVVDTINIRPTWYTIGPGTASHQRSLRTVFIYRRNWKAKKAREEICIKDKEIMSFPVRVLRCCSHRTCKIRFVLTFTNTASSRSLGHLNYDSPACSPTNEGQMLNLRHIRTDLKLLCF